MDEHGIIGSVEELAKRFGKSVRTVQRWVNAGMPRLPDGRFDALAVTAWRRKKKGAAVDAVDTAPAGDPAAGSVVVGAGPRPAPSFDDKDYWDKESKREQALLRKLDRRKREGELIELKMVEDLFVSRIIEVKTLLLSFERLLPPELIRCRTDREMAEVIRKHIRRGLSQFSRPLPPNMRPQNDQPAE